MALQIGSWGTPELGITEAIGRFLGSPTTSQGGSDLDRSSRAVAPSYTPPPTGPVSGPIYNGPQSRRTTTNTGGSVPGTSTASPISSPSAPSGPSDQELNEAYDPIFSYLNQAEDSLRSMYPQAQQDIQGQYGVSQNTLDTSRGQNITALTGNEQKVQQTKEDAMSQARRLYNELLGGYNQRFGGATSAGEAARTLAGNEAQRTMGGVNRDFGNNMATIQQKKVEVEQGYQSGLMQLQQTRDAALNQAHRDFQQKLSDITRERATTANDKSIRKILALQEMRNQAYNIEIQNKEFAQQLALQKQSDTSNLDSMISKFNSSARDGQTTANAFNPPINSNLQTSTSEVGGGSALTGQIGNRKDLTDYQGQIGASRTFDNLYGQNYGR